MTKTKNIKTVVEAAKKIVATKNGEISLLKKEILKANSEKTVTFKMPDSVEVRNFPSLIKVQVENQKDLQKVHVLNLKDIKVTTQKVVFPSLQKVHVDNWPEAKSDEKASGWVPEMVKHAVTALATGIIKRLDMGLTVKLDDSERLKPQPVIIVDVRGRPVSNGVVPSFIPMPGGSGRSGGTPPPANINSNRKVVTTAGTRVKLVAAATLCRKVLITAPSSNGGSVYVGGSNVSAVASSEIGVLLNPTGSASIDIDDVSKIWIDATVNGEGVTFTYFT